MVNRWRRFAARLALAVLVMIVALAAVVLFFTQSQTNINHAYTDAVAQRDQLRSQVDELNREADEDAKQAECRSRIAGAVDVIRTDRDNQGWAALVDASDGVVTQEERAAHASRIDALNQELAAASALNAHSVDICAQNHDFRPPPRKDIP